MLITLTLKLFTADITIWETFWEDVQLRKTFVFNLIFSCLGIHCIFEIIFKLFFITVQRLFWNELLDVESNQSFVCHSWNRNQLHRLKLLYCLSTKSIHLVIALTTPFCLKLNKWNLITFVEKTDRKGNTLRVTSHRFLM